jgi:1,4-alpha-glucan branching enzyme
VTPLAAAPTRVIVQFRLGDAAARDVAVSGDFNGWHPEHHLHQVDPGVWSVDVALAPGVYNYVFVVDGKTLRLDPLAPRVTDGFGGSSSRVAVLSPEARS